MNTNTIPEIITVLKIIKLDQEDFNRDHVAMRIGINPTESRGPILAPGKIRFNSIMDAKKIWGNTVTIFDEGDMPYSMLFHAYLLLKLKKEKSWDVNDALDKLRERFQAKERTLCEICEQYNLQINVSINIYTCYEQIPIIQIYHENLLFLSNIGASVEFAFLSTE